MQKLKKDPNYLNDKSQVQDQKDLIEKKIDLDGQIRDLQEKLGEKQKLSFITTRVVGSIW